VAQAPGKGIKPQKLDAPGASLLGTWETSELNPTINQKSAVGCNPPSSWFTFVSSWKMLYGFLRNIPYGTRTMKR